MSTIVPNPLCGKRYISLLRASTDMQETSPRDQKVANDMFAEKHGMIYAGDVSLLGVSGAKAFNRKDLKGLLERRRVLRNYDVIVVYDSSRLTRAGAGHASVIRHDFAKLGVLIISVMDPVPDGDFKEVIQTVVDTQNYLFVKKLSGFVARGIYQAVKNGKIERHGSSPLGVDRQYVSGDGIPLLRLHYLSGGRRQLIQEPDGKVIKEVARGELPVASYLLNPGERSRLVPGDQNVLDGIREAFTLRYRDNMGFTRIGKHLIRRGVWPLRASSWTANAVRDILINPTYLGWSYCFQFECGLYNAGGEHPKGRDIDQDQLEALGRVGVPRVRRVVTEMLEVKHPQLTGIITDPVVREAADKWIRDYFRVWHLNKERPFPFNHNNSATSKYFLRGVMRDHLHNRSFHGQTCGRDGEFRYYAVNPRINAEEGKGPNTRMRAEPLEKAVIHVLKEAFANTADIKNRVSEYVTELISQQPNEVQRQRQEAELQELKDRFKEMQQRFSAKELRENENVIVEIRARREQIEQELAVTSMTLRDDPTALVESICSSLVEFSVDDLSPEGCEKLRYLVKTVCPRVAVNLQTLEVEMDVALPKALIHRNSSDWKSLMSDPSAQVELNGAATHHDFWLLLGKYWLVPSIEGRKTTQHPRYKHFKFGKFDEPQPKAA